MAQNVYRSGGTGSGLSQPQVDARIRLLAEIYHGVVATTADLATLTTAKRGDEATVAADGLVYELNGNDPTVEASWEPTTGDLATLTTADSTTYTADGTTVTADAA